MRTAIYDTDLTDSQWEYPQPVLPTSSTGRRLSWSVLATGSRGCARLWVDGGYSGEAFADWVKERWPKLAVEVIERSDQVRGFAVLPQRWVVERTFGRLMRHWCLARDYERTESSAETWIHIAMLRVQLRRLA